MSEVVGSLLFLVSVGLSGAKLNKDFGDHGLWAIAMLIVLVVVYAAAIGMAFT